MHKSKKYCKMKQIILVCSFNSQSFHVIFILFMKYLVKKPLKTWKYSYTYMWKQTTFLKFNHNIRKLHSIQLHIKACKNRAKLKKYINIDKIYQHIKQDKQFLLRSIYKINTYLKGDFVYTNKINNIRQIINYINNK